MTRTLCFLCAALWLVSTASPRICATPANKAGLEHHYDRFLERRLSQCTTCHLPSQNKAPERLEDFPHNPFGQRLRELRLELAKSDQPDSITVRLQKIADDDSDDDGVANEAELLLGHNPGDKND